MSVHPDPAAVVVQVVVGREAVVMVAVAVVTAVVVVSVVAAVVIAAVIAVAIEVVIEAGIEVVTEGIAAIAIMVAADDTETAPNV